MNRKMKVTIFTSLMAVMMVSAAITPAFAETVQSKSMVQLENKPDDNTVDATEVKTEESDKTDEIPSSDVIIQSDDEEKVTELTSDADELVQISDDTYVATYESPEKAQQVQESVLDPDEDVDVIENLMFSVETDNEGDSDDESENNIIDVTDDALKAKENESESTNNEETVKQENQNSDPVSVSFYDGKYWVDETPYTSLRDLADATGKKLVAVIDTGASEEQNVINANLTEEDSEYDTNGHGSVIIQSITDNDNGQSIILSLKALGKNGTGYMSDVMKAVQYAIDEQVDYLNMSIAALKSKNTNSFEQLVLDAIDSGITVVAAGGNYNKDASKYIPACVDGVYSVGAASSELTKIRISNFNTTYWEVADSTSVAAAIVTGKLVSKQDILDSLPDGSDKMASEKSEYEPILVQTEEYVSKAEDDSDELQLNGYDVYVDPSLYDEMAATGGYGFITSPVDISEELPFDVETFRDDSTGYYHLVYADDETGGKVYSYIKENFNNLPIFVTKLETLFRVQGTQYAKTSKLDIHGADTVSGNPWLYNPGDTGEHSIWFALGVTTDGNGNNSYVVKTIAYYPSTPNEQTNPDIAELLDEINMPSTVKIVDGSTLYSGSPTYHTPWVNNTSFNNLDRWWKVIGDTFKKYGKFKVRYEVDVQGWLNRNYAGNWAAQPQPHRWYWVTSGTGRYLSAEVEVDGGGVFGFDLNIYDPNGTQRWQDGGAGSVEMQVNGGSWQRVYNEPATSYPYGTKFKFKNFTPGTGMVENGTSGLDSNWEATMTEKGLNIDFYTKWQTFTLDLNGKIDGTTIYGIGDYGSADVYINDSRVADDVGDWYQSYNYGTKYEIKDFKSKKGYTYTGNASYSGTITSDVGVYPTFTTNRVYIAYHPNGGTVSGKGYSTNQYGYVMASDGTVWYHGLKYGNSDDPYNATTFGLTRRGYNFVGWTNMNTSTFYDQDTSYDSTKYYGDSTSQTTANTSTVYCYVQAKWSAKQFTVEYVGNGGKWNDQTSWSNTATYDSNYTIESNFYTRTGYTFVGWTTRSDGKDDGYNWTGWAGKWQYINGEYGISNNKLTLYARWEPITYHNSIAHWIMNLSNGEGNNTGNGNNAYRAKLTTFDVTYNDNPLATFKMDNSKAIEAFNGLELTHGGSADITGNWGAFSIGTTVTQLPKNMYFEYYYTPVTYSITYDLNDADGSPESRATNAEGNPTSYNVYYGVSIKEPTRPGYTFEGWVDQNGNKVEAINESANMSFLASDGTTTDSTIRLELAKRRTGNVQLKATWKATAPSITAKSNYYMEKDTVTSDMLKTNASATDDLETPEYITSKITIKRITYEDGSVVENPTSLDTSKEQTVKVTYSVKNDRGGETEIAQTVKVVPKSNGGPIDETNPDGSPNIFARYINKDSEYTLPGNSKWRTEGYQNELESLDKSGDQYLSQYDDLLNQ